MFGYLRKILDLTITFKIDYINMQYNYAKMRLIHVKVQHDYINIQHNLVLHFIVRFINVGSKLKGDYELRTDKGRLKVSNSYLYKHKKL